MEKIIETFNELKEEKLADGVRASIKHEMYKIIDIKIKGNSLNIFYIDNNSTKSTVLEEDDLELFYACLRVYLDDIKELREQGYFFE